MSLSENVSRKRGRPRKHFEIDYVLSVLWYQHLTQITGLNSPTAISRIIMPKVFKKKDKGGRFSYKTTVLNRVRKGKRVPPDWLLKMTRRKFKDSDYWLDHPLRQLAKIQYMDPNWIYALIHKLDDQKITNLLFNPKHEENEQRSRLDITEYHVKKLDEFSSLESFTACLALMQENQLFGFMKAYHELSKVALLIFFRIVSQPVFKSVAHRLFKYLKSDVFYTLQNDDYKTLMNGLTLNQHSQQCNRLLTMVNNLKLLKNYDRAPLTCIYIAQQYFTAETFDRLWNECYQKDAELLNTFPKFPQFVQHLKMWEENNQDTDTINTTIH